MGLKRLKAVTPGSRGTVLTEHPHLGETLPVKGSRKKTKAKPKKSLIVPLKGTGGRNNMGRQTARRSARSHRRLYRLIDFKRSKDGIPATITAIEYDPNRNAHIALLKYADGAWSYILAPNKLRAGDTVVSGPDVAIKEGNALPLRSIPMGTVVHAIEMKPGKGAQIAKGAGCSSQLLGKEGNYAIIRLPSGEVRRILLECRATIGQVSNPEARLVKIGKAGRMRWKGKRPKSRGVAMNPVDHALGGGEGRTAGGRPSCNFKGNCKKGQKTRSPKKLSNKYIIRRRNDDKSKS